MKKLLCLVVLLFCVTFSYAQTPAKNVIWLIGDGMGPSIMGFFMEGVRKTTLPQYPDKQSTLEKFINASTVGMYFNDTFDTLVTDSAGSASQMAMGARSRPGFVSMNHEGKALVTIMEEALKQGKAVGVVTDVYVQDATPAAFLTHAMNRSEKYNIARQLINSGAQVVMGGGMKYFTKEENKDLLKQAKKQGWKVVTNAKELAAVKGGRVLGAFADEAMPFYGEKDSYPQTPTLLAMAQKAVEILSQNEKGFMLMVEAGKVDWALQDNEAGPSLWEMINLDETLAYLWNFTKKSGNTLLYLNADHESGVPGFHYRHVDSATAQHKTAQGEMLYAGNTDYVNTPYFQYLFEHKRALYFVYPEFKKLPVEQQTAEKLQEMVDKATGHHWNLHFQKHVPSYGELISRLNDAQGVAWATGAHSSGMMLGLAYGPGAETFSGVYHNTDIKGKLEKIFGF